METAAALSPASMNLTKPLRCSTSPSPSFFQSKVSFSPCQSITSQCFKSFPTKLHLIQLKARRFKDLRPVNASDADTPSSVDTERWLLEPVGDGDSRHVGFQVQMPGAFEISSNVVIVGRLPEKADMVIPVATVSGMHARVQKNDGSLLVTDLDSTNGTFIDGKRLKPGAAATASPGNCITFGDTHLAMFRVSKLTGVDVPSKQEESEIKLEADVPSNS